jgi:hypothetical protein
MEGASVALARARPRWPETVTIVRRAAPSNGRSTEKSEFSASGPN